MRVFPTLCLLAWGSASAALSCLPHDVSAVYQDAADSKDRYMVVVGKMVFDERQLPTTDMSDQNRPPDTRIPAQLKGLALSRSGFRHPYDEKITLNVQCFGPWCASAKSGSTYLAFVNLDADIPEVEVAPCGGYAFAAPTKTMKQQVIDCRNGGECVPKLHR